MNRVIQANYEMGSTFKPLTAVNGFDYGDNWSKHGFWC